MLRTAKGQMLPPPPPHTLLGDETPVPSGPPFLHVRRAMYRLRFENGDVSEPFTYDVVERTRLDAVVIAAHFVGADGRRHVYLRSALRPPVATRVRGESPIEERADMGLLWELPAGLVEVDERSPEGLVACAVRELHEELGFDVSPRDVRELGPSAFPAPGMVGERHFYFHVEVEPEKRAIPLEDGSPLERHAKVISAPLDELLDVARRGGLEDLKTELGLRRLAEIGPP